MTHEPRHTVGELVLKSAAWLQARDIDSPRLDAELLLCRVMDCDRLRLYMEWEKPMVELEVAAYRELIRRRGADHEPVARLLERKEFYGRVFFVAPGVFVPRPETEGLVERALQLLESESALQVERPAVFDIGTGSGCIVVTMAAEDARAQYHASDASTEALDAAERNAATLHVEKRIDFRQGRLLAGFDGPLHLLVSNPPYIRTDEIESLQPEVKDHDPRAALDGGEDGLDIVREIVEEAKTHLVPGGCILMEIGEEQEEGMLEVFKSADAFENADVERDDFGKPRYAFARRRG